MADLDRRVGTRVVVIQSQAPDGPGSLLIAPRLTPDRAVALLESDETIAATDRRAEIISRQAGDRITIVRVPAMDDSAVTIRQGAPRPGPRYLAVMEATPQGPVTRPVYIGRVDAFQDARTGAQLFSLAALQHAVPRGAALFTLDGAFIGLVRDAGANPVVVPAENLRAAVDSAPAAATQQRGNLGIEIDALSGAVARATGADRGVVVAHVAPSGPAVGVLRSGDVIQSVDGTAVSAVSAFEELERSRTPAAEVAITGVRRGAPLDVKVRAADGSAPLPLTKADDPGFVGLNIPGAGIEVVNVVPGGAAAAAGLRRGDLIVAMDGEVTHEAGALEQRFRAADRGTAILITVQRSGQHRVLALERQ
jgi:hypothetical protein